MTTRAYENGIRELTVDELDVVNGGGAGHIVTGPVDPALGIGGGIWHGPVKPGPHRIQPLPTTLTL